MLLWKNACTDPYRNMATEEYLLYHAEEPSLMLWQNAPAVIIGKNQAARAEVDFDFTRKNDIPVVRRLSGGGAVFHDLGNINYTFIIPDGASPDFAAFTAPVLEALATLGVDAVPSGRNDLILRLDGRKFSGTAECIIHRPRGEGLQKVLLHHGTLLFSADLRSLAGALTPDPEKLRTKGIKSVKSRVCNLREAFPDALGSLSPADFKGVLEKHFLGSGARLTVFSPEAEAEITALAEEKYKTDTWLFGRFSEGEKKLSRRFPFGTVTVALTKEGESIGSIAFFGDFFGTESVASLAERLQGVPLREDALISALDPSPLYFKGSTPKDIASLILDTSKE